MKFTGTIDFKPKLFSALRHYSAARFKEDLIAGIVVGIVALPLAIAFGIASGVSPTVGLTTAIIGGFLVSALGGNSVQIGGPTGAFIVIVYTIIQQYGLVGLGIATLMAGLMLIGMGLFRLGTVIKFIPYPIVVGFTAGIALTIFSTQINDFFGLGLYDVPGQFLSKWALYFKSFGQTSWTALTVRICALGARRYASSQKSSGALCKILFQTQSNIRPRERLSEYPLSCGLKPCVSVSRTRARASQRRACRLSLTNSILKTSRGRILPTTGLGCI